MAAQIVGTGLTDIVFGLKNIFQVIAQHPVIDKTLNRVRGTVIVESGTVTTVGTLSTITAGTITTVTGVTNVDGYQGKLLPISENMMAWELAVRARIS